MMLQDNHIHTSFSDGKNTPEEMILQSIKLGLSKITVTDHVRKDSDWVWKYAGEIERLGSIYRDINISIGVECKVIDFKGNIDCPEDILYEPKIEKIAAIHRIPDGSGIYTRREDIKNNPQGAYLNYILTLKGIERNQYVSRIAHPFSLFTELEMLNVVDWHDIHDILIKSDKKIEFNAKYNNSMVPNRIWEDLKDRIVVGTDSHCIEELVSRRRIIDEFIRTYGEQTL